jgi:hypothetical protein
MKFTVNALLITGILALVTYGYAWPSYQAREDAQHAAEYGQIFPYWSRGETRSLAWLPKDPFFSNIAGHDRWRGRRITRARIDPRTGYSFSDVSLAVLRVLDGTDLQESE